VFLWFCLLGMGAELALPCLLLCLLLSYVVGAVFGVFVVVRCVLIWPFCLVAGDVFGCGRVCCVDECD
jgi:hypothetical protein